MQLYRFSYKELHPPRMRYVLLLAPSTSVIVVGLLRTLSCACLFCLEKDMSPPPLGATASSRRCHSRVAMPCPFRFHTHVFHSRSWLVCVDGAFPIPSASKLCVSIRMCFPVFCLGVRVQVYTQMCIYDTYLCMFCNLAENARKHQDFTPIQQMHEWYVEWVGIILQDCDDLVAV
jgi:hypothetical protein